MTTSEWAALVAAPVASFLIIIGLIVVRGTTISQFRQKWIDDQRADLAMILSYSGKRIGATGPISVDDQVQVDLAYYRMLLREKPEIEPGWKWINTLRLAWRKLWRQPWGQEWQEPLAIINSLRIAVSATVAAVGATSDIKAQQQELVEKSRFLLKREWNRTRNGELGYKVLLLSSATIVLIGILPGLAGWVARKIDSPERVTQTAAAPAKMAVSASPQIVFRTVPCMVLTRRESQVATPVPARCLPVDPSLVNSR